MASKFDVYALVRGTRQKAGDIAQTLKYDTPEYREWCDIERVLNDLEIKLENMDLKG